MSTPTLAEIQAKRAAFATERKQREEAAAIETAQRELELDEQEAAVAKEHPKAAIVRTPGGVFGVVKPSAAAYQLYADQGNTSYEGIRSFVRPCIVAPELSEADRRIDEHPFVLRYISDKVMELAGLDRRAADTKR